MVIILAIHADPDSLALLERTLMGGGHQVVSCLKIGEAREWLKAHVPDLVIASAGRHGLEGSETVRLLKAAGLDGPRILLLTSADSINSNRKSLGHQVGGVVEEPVDQDELLARVRSALEGLERGQRAPRCSSTASCGRESL